MNDTIITPNMNLSLPVVGGELGPQYAFDINAAFGKVDTHNHTNGNGIPITPAGINVSSDLPFLGNNATQLRSTRWNSQSGVLSGPNDLLCAYVVGADLYYNDGNGNSVRMTESGGVAGSPGSISNLTSPASASYVSANSTFVWQSAANTPANLDAGSVIFRNIMANSNGVTVNAPNSLTANYDLQWPAGLPGAQSFVTLDASGNLAAPIAFANGITRTNLAAVGQQVSSGSGSFTTASSTPVQVTNLSIPLTTSGRPVMIMISNDGTYNGAQFGGSIMGFNGGSTSVALIAIKRGSSVIANFAVASASGLIPVNLSFLDVVSAGTYTYTVTANLVSGSSLFLMFQAALTAYEL